MHVVVLLFILTFWSSTDRDPTAMARAFPDAAACEAAAPAAKALVLARDKEVQTVHWQCMEAVIPDQDED